MCNSPEMSVGARLLGRQVLAGVQLGIVTLGAGALQCDISKGRTMLGRGIWFPRCYYFPLSGQHIPDFSVQSWVFGINFVVRRPPDHSPLSIP